MATLRSLPASSCRSNYSAARSPFHAGTLSIRIAVNGVAHRSRGVVLVQAKGRKNQLPGRTTPTSMPNMPKLDDDDTPKFVIFIRTKNVPRWYPLSIVSGGTAAKTMLAAMSNDWGKKLFGSTLTRNMASVIYKDEKAIRQGAFKTYPVLKTATGFQYGYKIVDSKNPRSALFSSDVVEIPPEGELLSFVDKVKEGFTNIATGVRDTFGSISPIDPEPEAEPTPKPSKGRSRGKKG